MNRIDSTRAIEKIWNVECKNGQLLYWNYNEECWAIKDDLKLLDKYKRAFEILKPLFKIENYNFNDEIKKIKYSKSFISTDLRDTKIEQEQYELLEELMKGEEKVHTM